MLTFTLILSSFITPSIQPADSGARSLKHVDSQSQTTSPDLTLMQGYERYLDDPGSLAAQRDA